MECFADPNPILSINPNELRITWKAQGFPSSTEQLKLCSHSRGGCQLYPRCYWKLLCLQPIRYLTTEHCLSIFFSSLLQAPRRILEEDATVRLSFYSYTIANNQTQIHQSNPTYERAFPLDLEYHQPATLLQKLPELSQSAEDSGNVIVGLQKLCVYSFTISLGF